MRSCWLKDHHDRPAFDSIVAQFQKQLDEDNLSCLGGIHGPTSFHGPTAKRVSWGTDGPCVKEVSVSSAVSKARGLNQATENVYGNNGLRYKQASDHTNSWSFDAPLEQYVDLLDASQILQQNEKQKSPLYVNEDADIMSIHDVGPSYVVSKGEGLNAKSANVSSNSVLQASDHTNSSLFDAPAEQYVAMFDASKVLPRNEKQTTSTYVNQDADGNLCHPDAPQLHEMQKTNINSRNGSRKSTDSFSSFKEAEQDDRLSSYSVV